MRTPPRALAFLSALTAAGLALAACGGGANPDEEADVLVAADAPTPQLVTLNAKEPGTEFADAAITDWRYAGGTFEYDYAGEGYELGEQTPDAGSTMCANSGKGQHIHLIVDNEPYVAKYEPRFEHALADGEHHVLTFLSRSYHESIKTPAAHRAARVTVADGAFATQEAIAGPMLFYSRPKGTYTGKDAETLLLDFYPVNVELGEAYKVRVEAGGQTFIVDTWQPYLLRGLPMGEHTVTLTLIDAEGQAVAAPHNPVSRTITLAADPLG